MPFRRLPGVSIPIPFGCSGMDAPLFDLYGWSVRFARRFGGISDNDARMFRRSATTLSHFGPAGGFTLVELLVLVTILGALSSVVVLAVSNVSSSASLTACSSEMRVVKGAQEAYRAQYGTYATGIDQLMQAQILQTSPLRADDQIATDSTGAVTASPTCQSGNGIAGDDTPSTATPPTTAPVLTLADSCGAAVDGVAQAQSDYGAASGSYATSVAALVKKGYLAADPSTSHYTIKTTKTGLVTSKPECANISEAACTAAVASVQSSQATRLAQTGKYASNLTQLINAGYLAADPSTDAYKITTNKKGTVSSQPDCAMLA